MKKTNLVELNYPLIFQAVYCEPLAVDPLAFQALHSWLWPKMIGSDQIFVEVDHEQAAPGSFRVGAAGKTATRSGGAPHLRPTRAAPVIEYDRNGTPTTVDERYYYNPANRADVAVIPIHGTLNKMAGPLSEACFGMVNTDRLSYAVGQVGKDSDAERIVLDINSPGGMVTGSHELAAEVRALRNTGRTIYGFVDAAACSAAQNIAAQCSEVYLTSTARMGSIGTIMGFLDRSEEMSKIGIRAEVFAAGTHKAAGSLGIPLTEADRKYLQESVEASNRELVASIKAGRRGVSKEALTDAKVYAGIEAVKQGLADGLVANWEEFLRLI